MLVPLATCTSLIFILVGRKILKFRGKCGDATVRKAERDFYTLFFDNSPALTDKLFEDEV